MRFFSLLFFLCFSLLLNAQQANNMTLLDSWEDPALPDAGSLSYNEVWGYVDCSGNEYGIFGSSAFVHFFDVTDPTNIVEVAAFEGGNTTVWRDMKTYQKHAYSVCDNCSEGLMVFDLSDLPNTVTLANQTTEYFSSSHNIFIDEAEGRLYVVGTNTLSNGVHIFDLTQDPANPTLLAEYALPGGYVHDLNVFNHKAFANSGGNGLYVYDFTDAENPVTLGTLTVYPEQGYNHSSWPTADGNHLVMADETHDRGLKYLNTSDLGDITVTDVFRSELLAPDVTGSIPHNPFIRGDYAFISYYHDGVQVFDVSDPTNVVQVAGYDTEPDNTNYAGFTGVWGVYPFLPSGTILASDTHRGFFTFSMDNIDLEVIEPVLDPEVVLTEMGDTDFCEGQSVSLFTIPGAETYEWFQNCVLVEGAEGNTFAATSTGDFTVAGANGHCRVEAEEVVSVTVTAYPDATIESTGDLFICNSNDPVTLEMPVGAQGYAWYLDGNSIGSGTNTLIASQPGIYSGFAATNNCITQAEEVFVNAVPDGVTLEITASSVNECAGETVTLSIENDFDSYEWTLNGATIAGATSTTLEVTETGTYAPVIVFTDNCTVSPSEIDITINEPIAPTVSANMNTLTASNASSFQWFLDGAPIDGATSQSFTATETGSYTLEVIDFNGCVAVSIAVEVIVSGIYSIEKGNVQILPNPFDNQLEIRLETEANEVEYKIFDITGKLVSTSGNNDGNSTISVDTNNWVSGMYVLEIILDGQSLIKEKIVKK